MSAAAAAQSQRIVVIDDDVWSARVIKRALPDHEVVGANTVAQGCALARERRPDLVVLDFYLPDGTGREAIARMREDGVSAPILLISGAFDGNAWSEWAAYEADDFLAKPFNGHHFRDKAERLLRMRELEEQVRAMRERDEREAEAARRLLDRMLARTQLDTATTRVESLPANAFGGDVVCAAPGPDGCFRWLVGDVAGHTLASALVTIPLAMIFYATARLARSLPETLQTYDRELTAMLPVTTFAAACQCVLDRANGTLSVANAGCPPVLIRRKDGRLEEVASTRRPLGISGAEEDGEAVVVVAVEQGDRIYTMSDGIVELHDAEGRQFGAKLRELLAESPAEEAFDRVTKGWRAHASGKREDDLTFVEQIV